MMNYKLITASGSFKAPANCTMLKLGVSVATGGGGGSGASSAGSGTTGIVVGANGGNGADGSDGFLILGWE